MRDTKYTRPTVGVLSGWQVYEASIPVSFLAPVIHGIRAAAHDLECNLLIACGMGPARKPSSTRPAWPVPSSDADFVPVGPWNTDGLIVIHPLQSETRSQYTQDLTARHCVVFVGASEGGPAVGIDNEGGIQQAMAHLVAHGHRRIAFIAGLPEDAAGDSGDRLRAYRQAVQEYGLANENDLIAYGSHSADGGHRAMSQILSAGSSFTAVVASNDESAIGAMQVLKKAGLRIPQDVAIIGFDDHIEAAVQSPPLTTVHVPVFERGYQALELLLEYIEGKKTHVEIIKSSARLIVRQSCGCPADKAIPTVHGTLTQSRSKASRATAITQFAQTISEIVLTETDSLGPDGIRALSRRLAETFLESLEQGNPTRFCHTFKKALQQIEAAEADAHIWQTAVSVLRHGMPIFETLFQPVDRQQVHQLAEDMVNEARVAISESIQQQHKRYVVAQNRQADRIGPMSASLLTALDEKQIYETLAKHLPQVGIEHAAVAFFAPGENDPLAESSLRVVSNPEGPTLHCSTRQFPPRGLYPNDRPFSLLLLPLIVQEEQIGFTAFSTPEMGLLGSIVRQLAAALNTARLYQEATEGRRLAEEANRLKSRFLSTVSHELRTPLGLIVGLSEVLREEAELVPSLPESFRQDLLRIHTSAQHLDGLIRDVLDLARSEMGQLKLTREPLDLVKVLEVIEIVGGQLARDKGLAWRAEIPPDLPRVWGDRTRLQQVALNLISNAVKFTARGEIILKAEADKDTVTILVSDTGLGIPPEEQEVIFDEFRQSERTAARGYGGLGLGLSICKRLVELHGGTIGARSSGEEGAGSTFYFTLPAAEEAIALIPQVAPSIQGQTVLILTEHADNGKHVQDHLTRQGFTAQVRESVTTNWLPQMLAAPPGAIVLDSELASEQGWETLNTLKRNQTTQDVPVLFYSLAQDSGAVLELDYLTKPVGTIELAQALERQGLTTEGDKEKIILIVDDEPGVLEMHARIVQAQSENWRVLKACNGQEALETIRLERPDLVLLDLMMPELDGFGVLEAMQQGTTTRDIPVVVLTGQVLTEEDMARLNQGVTTVLSKGVFSAEETLSHIETALSRTPGLGNETQRLVRKAMAYIHEHYAEPITRDDIARHVNVNKDYLTRCFRQETDVAPSIYLRRYRINIAKTLLAESGKGIAEIAEAVGFSDRNYFSRVFRQEVGMPPGAYRRR